MGLFDSIKKIFVAPRICCVCGVAFDYRVIMGYDVDKMLNARRENIFCVAHAAEEFGRRLRAYPGPVLFDEPRERRVGGSFFYAPDELRVHAYCQEDKVWVERALSQIPEAGKKDVVGCFSLEFSEDSRCNRSMTNHDVPVEIVDRSQFVKRFRDTLTAISLKYPSGEYWITEPRGTGGIFIFDDQI
ncbi:MAG: hypothetical protein HQL21_06545 [Candidatus Omnitrophica bacterium]|nr:hypothetical protein [Candidatus Omnitrophota bacterium]